MERRRELMGQDAGEKWDYIFEFDNDLSIGELISVVDGQILSVEWSCPNGNANGWVMNGNGCCADITQLRAVGHTGSRDNISVTASGQVRIGGYNTSSTFAVKYGTIKVRLT